MDKNLKKSSDGDQKPKVEYQPPTIESESIFETKALSCGKCRRTSARRAACSTLSSQS
jgi:hypothetical protein